MPRKFIDLSVSLQEGIKSDPDFMLPKINYHHHNETIPKKLVEGLPTMGLPACCQLGKILQSCTYHTSVILYSCDFPCVH